MRLLIALLAVCLSAAAWGDDLAAQFAHPPESARPWVYWFWNNGNVTREGITADLEAMQQAGVGGVIIMDVVERFAPPAGPADFMNAEWQDLFRFAVTEAHRLADLWLNRMIGDAALPPDQRLTWSTYEPFTKDQPLPKSGLLGPVTIQAMPCQRLPQ